MVMLVEGHDLFYILLPVYGLNLLHSLGDDALVIYLAACSCDIKSPEFANCRDISRMVGVYTL